MQKDNTHIPILEFAFPIVLLTMVVMGVVLAAFGLAGAQVITTSGQISSVVNDSFGYNQYTAQYSGGQTNTWIWTNGFNTSNMAGKNCTITTQWYTIKYLKCD